MNKNERQRGAGKPWLVVASDQEFEQYLEEIDRKLEERGGRSIAEHFRDVVDGLSEREKKILRARIINISEKYQGPGGP